MRWIFILFLPTVAAACASSGAPDPPPAPRPASVPSIPDASAPPTPDMGYTPKLSIDTVLDFAPDLAPKIAAMPKADVANLGSLLASYLGYRSRAAFEPGEWVEASIALGADEKEYIPSDMELLAAAAGDRLRTVFESTAPEVLAPALANANYYRDSFEYTSFDFRHVDVMGSGRFFYASKPRTVRVPLPPR